MQKFFGQDSTSLMIKALNKMDTEESCLNIINVVNNKTTVNIKLNSEKLKAFCLRSDL